MGETSRIPNEMNLSQDIFINTEPSPKPEDLSLSSSAIQPAQKPPATPVSWSSQLQKKKKTPEDYENDRVRKYAKYFKENEILPIPELVEAVEPKTLSFVVTDLRTRRLAGLKKESFEELLKLQASQVSIFTEGVLQPGMSCSHPKKSPRNWPHKI